MSRSQGRAKTAMANETSSAAIGSGPKVSGQMSKMMIVPIMIPIPDQKKAALRVVIDIEYKSSTWLSPVNQRYLGNDSNVQIGRGDY